MVDNGQISKETLCWKKISEIEELKLIFDDDMPPIPKQD